jgi:hypothetical protein
MENESCAFNFFGGIYGFEGFVPRQLSAQLSKKQVIYGFDQFE